MERPNIVFIMTDQLRWDAIGAYGNAPIQTPNLDRLAAEAVRFAYAFVPIPLCTPSRASFLTGQYPSRHGLYTNQTFSQPEAVPNLVRTCKEHGYTTALIGKDHLFGAVARDQLFDHAVLYDHSGRVAGSEVDSDERAVREFRRHVIRDRVVERDPHDATDTPTARITAAAIAALNQVQEQSKPFFLWLSYPDPHPPYVVAEPYASMYRGKDIGVPARRPHELDDKPLRQRVARQLMETDAYTPHEFQRLREVYYGMVTFLDEEIGRFLAALEAQGLSDDTLVIFTSDHGDYLGDHGLVRKSPAMYDCLVRIPFMMRWPGRIGAACVQHTLVESIDMVPTVLELTGLLAWSGIEGQSLAPLLMGQTASHKEHVFGLYGSKGTPFTADEAERIIGTLKDQAYPGGSWLSPVVMRGRIAMVRTLTWKLVYYQGGEGELYDLDHDPHELVNRYDDPSCAANRAELLRLLADHLMRSLVDSPSSAASDAHS